MNTLQPILDFYAQPRKHWIQGSYDDGHGGHCMAGVYRIFGDDIHHQLRVELRRRVKAFTTDPITWNDTPGRTWKEVVALLSQEDAA